MPNSELWVEKHRPKKLEEMVLSDLNRETFEKYLHEEAIPHLLFGGPPGSGKTTLARIIVDLIIKNDSDILYINGSDQTGVANIRENVIGFLKSPPMSSKIKIVFIDEADYLTGAAQANLRGVIENFHEVGSFIVTCNFMSKIIEPIQSRLQDFRLEKMSAEFCLKQCEKILTEEKIKFNKPDVQLVVKSLYPDIRRMIGTLQKHAIKGELKGINAESVTTDEKKVIGLMTEIVDIIGKENEKTVVNKNITQIQKIINSDREPEYRFIYQELFKSNIPPWAKIKVNQYANRQISAAIPNIHFSAMIWEIILAGKEFLAMFAKK